MPEKEPLDRLKHREENSRCPSDISDEGKLNGTVGMLGNIDKRLTELTEILVNVIRNRNEKEKEEKKRHDIETEWRHLAMVLDRLFFICYLIVIVLSLVIFFPRRSYG